MSGPGKVPTGGGESLGHNPFGALSGAGLPAFAKASEGAPAGKVVAGAAGLGRPDATRPAASVPARNRGRVDIRRTTAGRGGKTVTLVTGFIGIGLPEKETLCKKMRSACGCGGTVKDGEIEIQGDQREAVARILTEAGFRPVFAGG